MSHAYSIEKIAQPNWYWAAIGVTVRNHYAATPKFSQCQLAELQLGRSDCCASPAACNVEFDVERTLRDLGHFDSVGTRVLGGRKAEDLWRAGDLAIFEYAPKQKGQPPTFLVMLECHMTGGDPSERFSAHMGDIQTGLVTTRDYAWDIGGDCVRHYITKERGP